MCTGRPPAVLALEPCDCSGVPVALAEIGGARYRLDRDSALAIACRSARSRIGQTPWAAARRAGRPW